MSVAGTNGPNEIRKSWGQSRPVHPKAVEMGAKWPCSVDRRRREADRRGRETKSED